MNTDLQTRQLTKLQEDFVAAYTSLPGCIGKASKAAIAAGYSEKSAKDLGRQVLELPHVQAAIFQANRRLISGPLATLAVDVLRRILEDETAPIKVRADAAKTILDRGGFPAQRLPEEPGRHGKAPEEMDVHELENVIRRMKQAFENADQPMIDVTPSQPET